MDGQRGHFTGLVCGCPFAPAARQSAGVQRFQVKGLVHHQRLHRVHGVLSRRMLDRLVLHGQAVFKNLVGVGAVFIGQHIQFHIANHHLHTGTCACQVGIADDHLLGVAHIHLGHSTAGLNDIRAGGHCHLATTRGCCRQLVHQTHIAQRHRRWVVEVDTQARAFARSHHGWRELLAHTHLAASLERGGRCTAIALPFVAGQAFGCNGVLKSPRNGGHDINTDGASVLAWHICAVARLQGCPLHGHRRTTSHRLHRAARTGGCSIRRAGNPQSRIGACLRAVLGKPVRQRDTRQLLLPIFDLDGQSIRLPRRHIGQRKSLGDTGSLFRGARQRSRNILLVLHAVIRADVPRFQNIDPVAGRLAAVVHHIKDEIAGARWWQRSPLHDRLARTRSPFKRVATTAGAVHLGRVGQLQARRCQVIGHGNAGNGRRGIAVFELDGDRGLAIGRHHIWRKRLAGRQRPDERQLCRVGIYGRSAGLRAIGISLRRLRYLGRIGINASGSNHIHLNLTLPGSTVCFACRHLRTIQRQRGRIGGCGDRTAQAGGTVFGRRSNTQLRCSIACKLQGIAQRDTGQLLVRVVGQANLQRHRRAFTHLQIGPAVITAEGFLSLQGCNDRRQNFVGRIAIAAPCCRGRSCVDTTFADLIFDRVSYRRRGRGLCPKCDGARTCSIAAGRRHTGQSEQQIGITLHVGGAHRTVAAATSAAERVRRIHQKGAAAAQQRIAHLHIRRSCAVVVVENRHLVLHRVARRSIRRRLRLVDPELIDHRHRGGSRLADNGCITNVHLPFIDRIGVCQRRVGLIQRPCECDSDRAAAIGGNGVTRGCKATIGCSAQGVACAHTAVGDIGCIQVLTTR